MVELHTQWWKSPNMWSLKLSHDLSTVVTFHIHPEGIFLEHNVKIHIVCICVFFLNSQLFSVSSNTHAIRAISAWLLFDSNIIILTIFIKMPIFFYKENIFGESL